jgi:hypothetical protein
MTSKSSVVWANAERMACDKYLGRLYAGIAIENFGFMNNHQFTSKGD